MISIAALPKAELHLHIEGTFEPEAIFTFAERNRMPLRYRSVEALRAAYAFTDLQSFLDLYYEAMSVLRTEADFEELAWAYLKRARAQNVRHAEIFFDPQAHTARGISYGTVVGGLRAALSRAERELGMSTQLIACFLRDQSAESAMRTLDDVLADGERVIAVGLDSAEAGNPPEKFKDVFDRARANGLRTVAHAGEEGPPAYITQAIDLLGVSRVDHGVRCLEDAALVARLREMRMPLTVCPLSNVRLRVVDTLAHHPLKRMLDSGLVATVNSDDPAYFGGYIGENFEQTASALALTGDDLLTLARNAFEASFIGDEARRRYLEEIDRIAQGSVHA